MLFRSIRGIDEGQARIRGSGRYANAPRVGHCLRGEGPVIDDQVCWILQCRPPCAIVSYFTLYWY